MTSVHPLQLSQLKLFWEGFPQGLGVFMRIFDHSSRSIFARSHTNVGKEGLALGLHSISSQRCSMQNTFGMQCSQTSTVLLATAKPRLVHQLARWRSVICHSRELQSPVAACFTPLHPALCIALADVWLGCSCLAMETHSMKLSRHCS